MFEDALARYGYVVLFVGSGVEGDAVLAAAAFLAQQGKLNPLWTFLIAIVGSALASEVSFRIGKSQGAAWAETLAASNPKLGRIREWVSGRMDLLVFVSRFLWGFRLTIPALCGASGMTQPRFSAWNLAGAVVWATLVGAGSYFFGNLMERLWQDFSNHLGLVVAGLFGALFCLYLWRRRDRQAWKAIRSAVGRRLRIDRFLGVRLYRIRSAPVGPKPESLGRGEPLRGEYTFTAGKDWFSGNAGVWMSLMQGYRGRPDVRYLEIGSAEGRSMVWMFENILTHPAARAISIDPGLNVFGTLDKDGETLSYFQSNIRTAGLERQVRAIEGFSEIELRKLPVDEPFDIIYVDGNHRATGVLEDLVLSWRLLEPGGLLIADDYEWKREWDLSERPMMAIDFFVKAFGEELEVVHRRYQVILKKASAEKLAGLPKP